MDAQVGPSGARPDRRGNASRKDAAPAGGPVGLFPAGDTGVPDSLAEWSRLYLGGAVHGVRSVEVASKIELHLGRFAAFFVERHGHERVSAVVRREVVAWRGHLAGQDGVGLAPATVNAHLASASGFFTWVCAHDAAALPMGNPVSKVADLPLAALEPRALNARQVRTLKNVLDRLPRLHQIKGRRTEFTRSHAHSRPWRDRAIVSVLLSTGLRREELVRLDLVQVVPHGVDELRAAKAARLVDVAGKGRTRRTVFLSADARTAVADYLQFERADDADHDSGALFLAARTVASRAEGGRLSARTVNNVCERIGRWHDAEQTDPARRISPLRPHDLRHTFAFMLSAETGADAFELQRRLGHRSRRYIERYTNPPAEVAAGYVESL